MSSITVLSPIGVNRVESRPVSARVASLQGMRLGLLSNNKPNATRLMEMISQHLAGTHGLGPVVPKQKPHSSVGAENIEGYAQEVQAAIVAVGD